MKKLNKDSFSLKFKDSLKGYIFLIPLIIGLVYFFLIPIIKSFLFSVSDVTTDGSGYHFTLSGFSAYNEAINVHTSYRQTVVTAILDVLKTTPLILIFSFFLSSILNQEFKGKLFFRIVLFLPAVISIIHQASTALETRMGAYSTYKETVGDSAVKITTQFTNYMSSIGFGEEIVETITAIFDLLYSVVDDCSLQILIIFIGMQAISPALYEAANVEGATGWESFWFITFPMVSPMVFVCIIYTIVDSFTTTSGTVMNLINETTFTNLNISLGSAMGWIYFLIVGLILGLVTWIFSRFVFYYDT